MFSGVPTQNWTRSACNRATAYQVPWQPVFLGHNGTSFSLTTVKPPSLGNVVPLRIAGRYVRCSAIAWLVENNSGGWLCLAP
jgi:hypothetical protein